MCASIPSSYSHLWEEKKKQAQVTVTLLKRFKDAKALWMTSPPDVESLNVKNHQHEVPISQLSSCSIGMR
jgi:hypothetical protein